MTRLSCASSGNIAGASTQLRAALRRTLFTTRRYEASYPSGGLSSLLVAVVVEFAEFAECKVTYVVRLCACGLMAPGVGWE